MGWSKGSELMSALIQTVEETTLLESELCDLYRQWIDKFEDMDADTLDDCLGESSTFDSAYFFANPSYAGEKARDDGEPRESNPWSPETPQHQKWNGGGYDGY